MQKQYNKIKSDHKCVYIKLFPSLICNITKHVYKYYIFIHTKCYMRIEFP